jgi:N-terminal domain of anti-restriction factor ArdC
MEKTRRTPITSQTVTLTIPFRCDRHQESTCKPLFFLLGSLEHSFLPMDKDRERKRYTPKKDYQPEVTAADLTERVNGHLATLIEAITSGNTERLTNYLAFSSRFHRYSRRNQELIYDQKPEATRVASFVKWKKEGYQVAKDEKGIRILVPKFPKGVKQLVAQEQDGETEPDEKKATAREVFFVTRNFTVGSVFDVSQLTPDKRPPEFFTSIQGDHQALHTRLIQAVQEEGIAYQESLETHGAQGYSAGGLIVVRPDQPAGNKAAITAHEWAHELLHKEEDRRNLPKQVKECHAEATAFVVLSHFGVTIPYSAEYLRMWGNTKESVRRELDLVRSTATQIIEKLHSPGEQRFHDHAEPTEL